MKNANSSYFDTLITVGELINELSRFDKNFTVRIIMDSLNNPVSYPLINYVYPEPVENYSEIYIDVTHPDDLRKDDVRYMKNMDKDCSSEDDQNIT